MAPAWHLGDKSLCWMLHALVLMTDIVQTVSAIPGGGGPPKSRCTYIHREAFSDEALKPGVCYLASDEVGVFLEARTFCQGLGGSLGWDVADIEDAVELQLIHDAIADLTTAGTLEHADIFYIGQNDMKTENVWRYLNDSSNKCNSTVFLNWGENQPDFGRRGNCISYFSSNDEFRDCRCDIDFYYLCKVKITSDIVPFCPNFTEVSTTEAPDECVNILPDAFGNRSVPGVCYASNIDQTRDFDEALSFCRSLPGGNWSVADIEDADENLFLEVWNRDTFPKIDGYWVGQNEREQEGDLQYTSISGQCPVYNSRYSNQPDGLSGQNCRVMIKKLHGAFQDEYCNALYYTLCKLKTGDSVTRCDVAPSTEVADVPQAYPCSNSSSIKRPRRFVFLSSDATCNPQDALASGYHANSRIQCARDCLSRDNCQGFGFVAAGKADDCTLCSRRVHSVQDLLFKAGSLYYNEAL